MEFRLLGQLEVLHAGEPLVLRGRKLRALLAVLLLNANRSVSVERLVDALWEDRPPDSARPTLQYFVHRLRKSLSGPSGPGDLLLTQAGGYLLRIKPADLDTERFRRELARARQARDDGDLDTAAMGFERALKLWRGPALADFAEEAFAQSEIARLEEMRLTAIEEDADVRLRLGRHAELVGELEGLVRAHTLRERLLGQLILALYRSGRQVEALGTYRAARRRLVTELGIEPGAELQRLERAILAQDPALELPPTAGAAGAAGEAGGERPAEPPAAALPGSLPGTVSGEPAAGSPPAPARGSGSRADGAAAAAPAPAREPAPGPRQPAAPQWPQTAQPDGAPAGQREPGSQPRAVPAAAPRSRRRQPAAARPLRAERKLITVLVASVAETAPDPEDLRAKHAAALQRIRHEVERHGGLVYAAIGGTVLTAFGIPRTREDDPERAVRAALRIAFKGQVRVGVDTGEAVVAPHSGSLGALGLPSGLGAEATLVAGIAGTVVDTASALLAVTPVGAVLVGAATYRSTKRVIDYPGHPSAGGNGWQPIAPRSRISAVVYEPTGEQRSPLIERANDLALLRSLLDHVRRELGPQLVTVVGAAGIGKTRLVGELGQAVENETELVTWRQGRSIPADNLGERTAFWAFAEIIRAHAGIRGADDDEAVAAKLHGAVVDAIGEPAEAAAVEQHLRPLVGLEGAEPVGGDLRETFAAWARFIEALAADRPLALVFEDLQWADDAMLDFIEDVVDLVGPVPLLVIATARPELLERRRDWGGGKRNAVIASLTPLSEQGSAQLLDARLSLAQFGGLPPRTRKLLLARSGGNPLFLEEYVRMLQDEPRRLTAAPLPIPQTIQQLITSRLDALEPEDKALLEDLAVLGEANWAEPLAAISGLDREQVLESLHRLERRELLRRTRATSAGGEHGYAFRHALIRDVAYGQLLRADRADRHHRAAEWLERHGDTVSERADLLARHYERVIDLTREPEEVIDAARVAFRAAGDRASALGALPAAAHWYRRALKLWPAAGPDRAELLLRLGASLVFSAHTGEDLLTEARQAFEFRGDTAKVRRADRYLAQLNLFHGHAERAREYVERATVDGQPAGDQAGDLPWLGALGSLLSCDYDEAIAAADEVAERGRAAGNDELVGVGVTLAGTARLLTGDQSGIEGAERGIQLLDEARSPGVAFFRVGLAESLWWWGDLRRCERTLAVVLDSVPDSSPEALWAGSTRTLLDYASGRWNRVLRFVDAAVNGEYAGTLGYQESTCRMARARIRFGHGDLDGALDDAQAAVNLATTSGNRRNRSVALALTGRILLTSGHLAEAINRLDQLLEDAKARKYSVLPSLDLVSLLVDLGRAGDLPADLPPTRWREAALAFVERDFLRAAAVYAEIGSQPDEAVTRLRAAVQLANEGRAVEARREAQRMADFSRVAGSSAGIAVTDAMIASLDAAIAAEAESA